MLSPSVLRRNLLPAAVAGSVVAVVVIALPTVWWSPLNVDEELTLRIAQFSFGHIFHVVSTERGGGPVHFWLEGGLQSVWPGLPSLRVPSLIFLCLALPAVALIARQLAGDEVAAAVVLLTAVSPIPMSYATFGRPHTLLFAWLMWGTVLVLRAARDGDRRFWVAGGAVLGLTVFVHPTAPLYALTAFGVALIYAPRDPRTLVREAWPGAVALLVTFLPYYATTLHVLGDRYGVGSGKGQAGRTFSGRPVWEDALHFVAPGAHDINYFTALAAVGIVALAIARRWRLLLLCALTVAAPVVFFSVVPTSGDSALFFDRYMIPVTPAFLVVVVAGIAFVARWAGRLRFVVFVLLVAGLLAVELRYDADRRDAVHGIALGTATHSINPDSVLFGSTGTSGPAFASFDYGHPANLFGHYVALRVPVRYVPDDACTRVAPFLASGAAPAHGLWLFYANTPVQFAPLPGVTVEQPTPRFFVVRSTQALSPRALVELGLKLRRAWQRAVPANTRVAELIAADEQALAGSCANYPSKDELGDPGTSPHWPPVKGPQ